MVIHNRAKLFWAVCCNVYIPQGIKGESQRKGKSQSQQAIPVSGSCSKASCFCNMAEKQYRTKATHDHSPPQTQFFVVLVIYYDSLNNQTEFGNFLVTILKQWANLGKGHWETFILSQVNITHRNIFTMLCPPYQWHQLTLPIIPKVRGPFSTKRNRKSNGYKNETKNVQINGPWVVYRMVLCHNHLIT